MEEFSITLPYKAYGASVKGTNSIKAVFLGGVRNSKQTYAGQSIVEFDKPSIKIEVNTSGHVLTGHFRIVHIASNQAFLSFSHKLLNSILKVYAHTNFDFTS